LKYLGLVISILTSALFSLTLYGKYFTHGELKKNIEYLMLYDDQLILFDITQIIWPGLIASLFLVLFVIKDFKK